MESLEADGCQNRNHYDLNKGSLSFVGWGGGKRRISTYQIENVGCGDRLPPGWSDPVLSDKHNATKRSIDEENVLSAVCLRAQVCSLRPFIFRN
jgi:hypothetical protein